MTGSVPTRLGFDMIPIDAVGWELSTRFLSSLVKGGLRLEVCNRAKIWSGPLPLTI